MKLNTGMIVAIVLLAFGWIFRLTGALFKLESWEFASELIIIGTVVQIAGLLLLVWKIIAWNRNKTVSS